jgi:hypothetical protein
MKNFLRACSVVMVFGTIALAATMGDQKPAGKYGVKQCPADGGTASIPLLPNQNAIALRNFLGDGGTAQTVYVGFDTSVTAANGFPIKDQEVLSIDVVAVTQNTSQTLPALIDGGVSRTTGTLGPTIYCTAGTSGGSQDLRYIEVK